MPDEAETLESLRAIIVGEFPALNGVPCTLLNAGWDSLAVDAADQWIFKFPRNGDAETSLRREARLLTLVGDAVSLPVPRLTLFETPRLFSRHAKIAGEHLLAEHYASLDDVARAALGETLGQFYAELHGITPEAAVAAGALPLETWLPAETILRQAWPVLPPELRSFAETTLSDWSALPPDPLGITYGYFDGHGWNMAFDAETKRLNGVYDFADSGIGAVHEEFIFSNFIAADLTERIVTSYEKCTGRHLDRDRIALLTGTHRLWELAVEAGQGAPIGVMLAAVVAWANRP